MFQISDPKKKRRVLIGFVVVIGMCLLLMIILLPILIPGRSRKTGPEDRIECPGFKDGPECESHGCVYNIFKTGPSCYMRKDSFGYKKVSSETRPDGITVKLVNRSDKTPYGPSWTSVIFETFHITENVVRVKLRHSEKQRYEVPVQEDFPLLKQKTGINHGNLTYEVIVIEENDIFSFQIKRSSDGKVLWDTGIGGLALSDQYLQVASYLPSTNVYGLGEHTHETLRHDMDYKTWPMFARDRPPEGGHINLYGVHPFYTCLEKSTKSHGVLLLNSNAMEVTLMPFPAVSFRTIGGILDLFFLVGDNPEHVVQLYTSLVGRPVLPPYWSLGFQLSRYGYNSLEKVKEAVERTRSANIAQDVQFLDIDHMDENRDFTISKQSFKGLIDYINKTKVEYDLKWIIILDPAIAALQNYDVYESGLRDEVFIKRSPDWKPEIFPEELRNVNVTFGRVWPNEEVAFPDFFNKKAEDWWINTIAKYHRTLPFDGLWIDMNEPANFGTNEENPFYCQWSKKPECWVLKCPHNIYDDPPYNPLKSSGSERISKMTLCMASVQNQGGKPLLHYDVHSLYGWSQSQPTLKGAVKATNTRSLVISRSTYPSSGRYAGHWLGDNKSTWDDLRRSIIGMLEFNLFGIPYIGADVCGFFQDTTEELCTRWMQLGAFYPFFRNHNGIGQKDQDPVALGVKVEEASRLAVQRRYNLLPYLYTLFYRAHVDGSTVVRPLFHEFAEDANTWNNGEQFMWGKYILVSPIIRQGQKSVKMYLPKTEWWHFRYNESSQEQSTGSYVERGGDSDLIPMHVRGGSIIPTEEYRLKQHNADPPRGSLFIFPQQDEASGELYIDDGLSIDPFEKKDYILYKFTYNKCKIEFKKESNGNGRYSDSILEKVYVYKVKAVDQALINMKEKYRSLYFDGATNMMCVEVNKKMKDVDVITWADEKNECQMLP